MDRINVTKSFLPPIQEYEVYLREIWENDHLTNQGPLLQKFEENVLHRLKVQNFQFVANGTLALQLALSTLGKEGGEVITTPFSYVATTSAILWERFRPVYVDIEPETFSMDPSQIEAAITPRTKAILPVHVFGFPCDVEAIDRIAKKHNIKVIYDAAHAFGVSFKGKSLLDYGDISTCSFHSTKLFHTIEGGGLVIKDAALNQQVELAKRFGHDGDAHKQLGINAKASEFQAAMGIVNLNYLDEIITKRQKAAELYSALLNDKVHIPRLREGVKHNFCYYPVIFKDEATLLQTFKKLNAENIFPRRYFYPSLNKLPYLKNNQICPISEDISSRIACLPLYVDIDESVVRRICEIINL